MASVWDTILTGCLCLQTVSGSSSQWASPNTDLAPGNFTVQWGPDETRNVTKQYVGEFTLKSGGKVSCLAKCT